LEEQKPSPSFNREAKMTTPRTVRVLTASLLLLAVLALSLSAQVTPETGDRIRVKLLDGSTADGTFVTASPGQILLEMPNRLLEVSIHDARKVEVHAGTERRFMRRFGISVGVLSAASAATGALLWSPCEPTVIFDCLLQPSSRSHAFVVGAFVGGVIGVPVGLLLGAIPVDRWEPAMLSQPLIGSAHLQGISVGPDGFAVSLSLPVGVRAQDAQR